MSATVVTLEMPARSEYLILARLALAGIAQEVPMSEAVLADLKLVVTEACGNAVRHASSPESGVVQVRFELGDGEIRIAVEDEGGGAAFAGDDVSFPEEPAESGMGLAIIQAIVDELRIERREDGRGTVVRMRKRLGA